jgi:hypothetical protein
MRWGGQVDLGQVDQLVAQLASLLRLVPDPRGDAGADPRRAGAADHDRDALAGLRLFGGLRLLRHCLAPNAVELLHRAI